MSVEKSLFRPRSSRTKATDYDNSDPVPQDQNVILSRGRQILTTRVGISLQFLYMKNITIQPHQSRGKPNDPSTANASAKYALEILKKHNMDNCHSIGTPLATKPEANVRFLSGEPVDQSDYRSKIGSLMYLTSSRPDLVQAIWLELTACSSDADQPIALNTQKSTSGGIQFLGDKLVSWMSKKQNCTVMSSAEAEYVLLILQVVLK
ncbi:hypothetical protein Tco_0788366 [Tanacetum coccineum]